MNIKKQTTSETAEHTESLMHLVVTGVDGSEVLANIWPTLLTESEVSAIVSWEGTDVISTMVRAEGDKSVQTRLLTLAYAATGPNCVKAIPAFSSGNWEAVRLSMPDVEHPDCWIHIDLIRATWAAQVSTSPESTLTSKLEITKELRQHEVGTVLFEMASRLLHTHQRIAASLELDALSSYGSKQ